MKITNLKKNDILYGTIGMGNLPPNRITQKINQLNDALRKVFKHQIVLIGNPGCEPLQLEIIRLEQE